MTDLVIVKSWEKIAHVQRKLSELIELLSQKFNKFSEEKYKANISRINESDIAELDKFWHYLCRILPNCELQILGFSELDKTQQRNVIVNVGKAFNCYIKQNCILKNILPYVSDQISGSVIVHILSPEYFKLSDNNTSTSNGNVDQKKMQSSGLLDKKESSRRLPNETRRLYKKSQIEFPHRRYRSGRKKRLGNLGKNSTTGRIASRRYYAIVERNTLPLIG